jgi:hypothetical protein
LKKRYERKTERRETDREGGGRERERGRDGEGGIQEMRDSGRGRDIR